MATPANDSYAVASGRTISAGRNKLSQFWRDLPAGWTEITPTGTAPYHGILAYSGIGFDISNGKLYSFGGGHNDYGGEDVWEFDYENRLPWEQHYTAQVYQGIPLAAAQAMVDNINWPGAIVENGLPVRPISRHTYKSVHWIESIGQLAAGGGSTFGGNNDYLWYQEGAGTGAWWNDPTDYWTYAPNVKQWTYKGSKRKDPAFDPSGSQHLYAKEIDKVFAITTNGNNQVRVVKWNPQTNTWTASANVSSEMCTDVVACYDSLRNKLIILAVNNYAQTTPVVIEYDTTTDQYSTVTTSGNIPVGWYSGSGMVYSTKTNSCLFLKNGASLIYKLNLNTLTWSSEGHTLLNMNQVEGRWFYDTRRNTALLVYTTGSDVRVFAYKEA